MNEVWRVLAKSLLLSDQKNLSGEFAPPQNNMNRLVHVLIFLALPCHCRTDRAAVRQKSGLKHLNILSNIGHEDERDEETINEETK